MEKSEKRKRGVNFTSRECNLLFSIIADKYKTIIENKETNACVNEEKTRAWENIRNEFNCQSVDFNSRSIEQLKKCYENRKRKVKKDRAEIRQEILKTGGGPPPPPVNPDDDLVLSVMDPLTVEGDQNDFDSDRISTILPGCSEGSTPIEYIFSKDENIKARQIYIISIILSNIKFLAI